MRDVIAASWISAAASLPLHVMPLIVAAVSVEGQLPLHQAGWVASAYMLGQLASTLSLPSLRMKCLTASQAVFAAILFALGLTASVMASSIQFIACWFAIGLACGALQFLGATTAAAARNKQRAFAIRLATVLLVSAATIAAVHSQPELQSYENLASSLLLVLTVITVSGVAIYVRPNVMGQTPRLAKPKDVLAQGSGLLVVSLLFVGQSGFSVYVVQGATQRGLDLQTLAYSMAFAKASAGVLLLFGVLQRSASTGSVDMIRPGLSVATAIVLVSATTQAIPFFLGLLLWELATNVLSARLQAAAVERSPQLLGPLLPAVIMLGAAIGPFVHGIALQHGMSSWFIFYAVLAAIAPALWWTHSRSLAAGLSRP